MNRLATHASEAESLHYNLAQRLRNLRFTPRLESDFLVYLRTSQRLSTLSTLVAVCLVWSFYALLDFWRLQALSGSGFENHFFWRSIVLRWLVFGCFACSLYTLLKPHSPQRDYEASVCGSILTCSMAIAASSYTLKNANMPDTSVVMVLIVCVAFFPLGVRFRIMVWIAAATVLLVLLSGPALLRSESHMLPHWVLSAVMCVAFVLSGVAAYHREKGQREQFLLRRLLNWEATHDPLTGLANRRMFHEHLKRCMRLAQREQETLFLVLFDIDYFKHYNDHYGHAAGDKVLCKVASLLQRHAQRPMDLAARLGGEEFALIIYGMQPDVLKLHLQRMQDTLAGMQLAHAKSPTAAHITFSIGATAVTAQDSPDSAFQRADALLYQAKHQGRNQICV